MRKLPVNQDRLTNSMFDLPVPRKSFTTHFHCTACGHNFRRELRRIYVHLPAFDQEVKGKRTKRSPYVIPQHITCPKCGEVDQYELARQTLNMLSLTMLAFSLAGGKLAPGHPVQPIVFGLHDGTIMHPLDALDHYRGKIERTPTDIAMRMRYANTLRTLGWLEESEQQYQFILDADQDQLEAWLGLASLHVARKHPAAARKALSELAKRAPLSRHPERVEYEAQARAYLEDLHPLDDLTPESLLLHSPVGSKPARYAGASRRHKK